EPQRIEVRFAEVHGEFKDPAMQLMTTGGSTSISNSYDVLRRAGAGARSMLVAAAAQRWKLDAAALRADNGVVYGPDGNSATYAELAGEAAAQRLPSEPDLTDPAEFRYIGRFDQRLDARAKVD